MKAFNDWWGQASSRDQMMLLVGGVFVVVYLLFVAVLGPVHDMRDAEVRKNTALRGSLERVKELAAKVMEKNAANAGQQRASSIESVVQRSLGPSQLTVSAMNAEGSNGVRLRFDDAAFDRVLKWLHEMEVNNGLKIKDLNVNPTNTPGLVNVNLRMEQ